jgi:hypothetical protein
VEGGTTESRLEGRKDENGKEHSGPLHGGGGKIKKGYSAISHTITECSESIACALHLHLCHK